MRHGLVKGIWQIGERTGRHLRRVVKVVEKAKENSLSIKMEKMEGVGGEITGCEGTLPTREGNREGSAFETSKRSE